MAYVRVVRSRVASFKRSVPEGERDDHPSPGGLNARGRQLLKADGKLTGPEIEASGTSFALGDRSTYRRRRQRQPRLLERRMLDERLVDIPARYLDDGYLTRP